MRSASPRRHVWALGILVLMGVLAVGKHTGGDFEELERCRFAVRGLSLDTGIALLVPLWETYYVALGEKLLCRWLLGGVLFRRVGFASGNVLQIALLLLSMMPPRGRRM